MISFQGSSFDLSRRLYQAVVHEVFQMARTSDTRVSQCLVVYLLLSISHQEISTLIGPGLQLLECTHRSPLYHSFVECCKLFAYDRVAI